MSASYILLVFIPSMLVVLLAKAFFRHKITMLEWTLQLGAVLLSTGAMWLIVFIAGTTWSFDSEILNGQVTSKESVHVTCEHEHQCGETCRKNDDGKLVCKPKYCKDHAYDVDWDVHSTVGSFTIDRVDKRGLREPPRWAAVQIGEPAATTGSGRNYMLLDEHHFDTSEAIMATYAKDLPKYPEPEDYYRLNRVINDTGRDYQWINEYFNDKLRTLGKALQLNIVVVITNKPYDYYTAIRQHWKGTKRNDIQLFYGLDSEGNIKWFKADSFADGQSNQSVLEQLRIPTLDTDLNPTVVNEQMDIIQTSFKRLSNDQLAYMKDQWSPSIGFITFVTILNLLITCVLTWLMASEDLGEYNKLLTKKQRRDKYYS